MQNAWLTLLHIQIGREVYVFILANLQILYPHRLHIILKCTTCYNMSLDYHELN
jgi:hypothetical protein